MWDFISEPERILFLFFALLAIGGAVYMISFIKVVHMILALTETFLSLAGLYLLLNAEFIAFVQVLIYAGALTILMMFGIMLTKHEAAEKPPKPRLHQTVLKISGSLLFIVLFVVIQQLAIPKQSAAQADIDTLTIGKQLFTQYVIPFELVSLLLTVAFIGSILIAKKEAD